MAVPLVEMHARLSQLTRQTQEIARGDYSQRIDFMGEFSEAFNSMVVLLEERERTLTDEIARRKQAEHDLQRERDLLVAGPVVTFRWGVDDEGTRRSTSRPTSAPTATPRRSSPAAGACTPASSIRPTSTGSREDGNDKSRTGLESWTQEYRILDADGETHWIRDFTHAVRDDEGAVTAFEGYIIDVTPQKAAEAALRQREEQLRMLSLSDELTGLYNRRGLFALGEHTMRIARRRGRRLGVIYVDVDGLKTINDRFGHAQGDEALRMVADVIRASIRESDVVGRIGGDEFVILAEDDTGVTEDLVARLRRRARARQREGRTAVPPLAQHRRCRLGARRARPPCRSSSNAPTSACTTTSGPSGADRRRPGGWRDHDADQSRSREARRGGRRAAAPPRDSGRRA